MVNGDISLVKNTLFVNQQHVNRGTYEINNPLAGEKNWLVAVN